MTNTYTAQTRSKQGIREDTSAVWKLAAAQTPLQAIRRAPASKPALPELAVRQMPFMSVKDVATLTKHGCKTAVFDSRSLSPLLSLHSVATKQTPREVRLSKAIQTRCAVPATAHTEHISKNEFGEKLSKQKDKLSRQLLTMTMTVTHSAKVMRQVSVTWPYGLEWRSHDPAKQRRMLHM